VCVANIYQQREPCSNYCDTNQKPSSISNKKDPINKVKKQVKPAEPLATVLPGNFLTLRIKKYSKERPDVYFGRQQTIVFDDKTHWKIMLGISMLFWFYLKQHTFKMLLIANKVY